jgi:DNA-binding MarR family transcriptional regulator
MNQPDIQRFRKALRIFEHLRAEQVKLSTSCTGVSAARCHTLLALREHMPCSLNHLAGTLCLEKSTVSRTVDGLVRAGLVSRVDNPENRREAQLSLTSEGSVMARRIDTDGNALFGRTFGDMAPADAKILLKTFVSFTEAFGKQLSMMKPGGLK